jgi:hypothetical protein
MTTRRHLLGLAGAALVGGPLTGVLTGCERRTTITPTVAPPRGARLLAEVRGGLTVVDPAGHTVVPAAAGVYSPDWTQLVTARDGKVTVYDTRTGRASDAGAAGTLQPRIVAANGRTIGLVTPAETGTDPYRPGARYRTTIEARTASGTAGIVYLPGNLEPEAFSADGRFVYVLDYLPPAAPDRYRVRQVELATGELLPLNTRLKSVVPAGAEEEMRGEGRQAVYDPTRQLLFTLYTHQPDHLHTRDLIRGARAGKPHVHAFVHTLSLAEGWAYCVDLPAPFGERAAAGHAIAIAPRAASLSVIDVASGALAVIDPDGLTVTKVARFTPLAGTDAAAAFARPWQLVVAAGAEVVTLDPAAGRVTDRWAAGAPTRGLAVTGDTAYLGVDGAVTAHELSGGRQTGRTAVPGLVRLRHALPPL